MAISSAILAFGGQGKLSLKGRRENRASACKSA
jgi:hypothetical protein